LELAGYLADEIAVMSEGRIVERGLSSKLLHRPEHPQTQSSGRRNAFIRESDLKCDFFLADWRMESSSSRISVLSFLLFGLAPGDYLSEMRLNPQIFETLVGLRHQYGLMNHWQVAIRTGWAQHYTVTWVFLLLITYPLQSCSVNE